MPKIDIFDLPCSKQEHQTYIHQKLSEVLLAIPRDCNLTKIEIERKGEDIRIQHSYNGNDRADFKSDEMIETLSVLYCMYLSYCKKYNQDKYMVQTENENRIVKVMLIKNKNWSITIMIKTDNKDLSPEIV